MAEIKHEPADAVEAPPPVPTSPEVEGLVDALIKAAIRDGRMQALGPVYTGSTALEVFEARTALLSRITLSPGGDLQSPTTGDGGVDGRRPDGPGLSPSVGLASDPAGSAASIPGALAGWLPIGGLGPQTNAVLGRWCRCGDNEDGSEFWYWQEGVGRWYEYDGKRYWELRGERFDRSPFYGEAPEYYHPIPPKPSRARDEQPKAEDPKGLSPQGASPVAEGEAPPSTPAHESEGARIPDGWVLVPRDPTQEQLVAGNRIYHDGEVPLNIYRTMVAASPRPSQEKSEGASDV